VRVAAAVLFGRPTTTECRAELHTFRVAADRYPSDELPATASGRSAGGVRGKRPVVRASRRRCTVRNVIAPVETDHVVPYRAQYIPGRARLRDRSRRRHHWRTEDSRSLDWVLNKAGVKRELVDTVKARKLAYYGHTMRKQGSCLEKEIMQGTMPGARRRGTPRTAWMGNIKTWTALSVEESVRMTEDRDKW